MMTYLVHLGMIMMDVFALLNVILIVDVLFGAKLVYTNRKLTAICAGFFVMEIFLEYGLKWDRTWKLVCMEYLFMFLTVFFFAAKKNCGQPF